MADSSGVDNFVWAARGVFLAAVVVVGVMSFVRLSGHVRVAILAMAYILIALNKEQPNLFMEACTNHSTAAACTNYSRCELVQETFDIDEEWGVYRRNMCIDGMPTDKTRLYTSYDPERCSAWGDCSATCTDKLVLIRAEIDGYECPAGDKQVDVFSSLDSFPLSNSSVMKLFPFNYEGAAKFWGWLAVGLCIVLMAKRVSAVYTQS